MKATIPVGIAAKMSAGKMTAPSSSRFERRSRTSLPMTAPMKPGRIRPRPAGRARRPRRRDRGTPARASRTPRGPPTIRAPASTRVRTSSGLSPRGSLTSTWRTPSFARAAGHERQRRHEVDERLRPARADELDPDAGRAVAAPQARRRVDLEQRSAHDPDPVAQPLGLVQVVRADDDRATLVAEGGDEVTDRLRRARVQRAGRLVEVEHLRLVDERARDRDLLAHALAEAPDTPIGGIGHVDDAQVAVDGLPKRPAPQAVQASVVGQVLAGGELVVQSRRLGQDAGDGPDALRVDPQLVPVDPRAAAARRDQAGEHADGRRLARPVRTEDAEDLTVAHGEARGRGQPSTTGSAWRVHRLRSWVRREC